ncbi:GAD domain-containing protein, partial [Treponema endosymbiont of Eucomonympha sp.]|uniref:GAD domain-containing protein n=1 Tax=Treponema endosymbiont of Eucomonympha sp. TaxID=1580831 RepID=UPI000ADE8024
GLRFGIELENADFLGKDSGFRPFKEAYDAGGCIKALAVPGAAEAYSRKKIEELEETAKIYKAKGFAWMKVCGTENAPSLEGGAAKFFTLGPSVDAKTICAAFGAAPGDLLLFASDAQKKAVCAALGAVRGKLGKDLKLIDAGAFAFAWVVDFP